MISSFLDMRQRRGPLGYLAITLLLAAITYAATHGIMLALAFNPHLSALSIFLSILVGILCYSVYLTQTVRRINDFHGLPIVALISLFPAATVLFFLLLSPAKIFSTAAMIIPILGFLSMALLMRPGRPS